MVDTYLKVDEWQQLALDCYRPGLVRDLAAEFFQEVIGFISDPTLHAVVKNAITDTTFAGRSALTRTLADLASTPERRACGVVEDALRNRGHMASFEAQQLIGVRRAAAALFRAQGADAELADRVAALLDETGGVFHVKSAKNLLIKMPAPPWVVDYVLDHVRDGTYRPLIIPVEIGVMAAAEKEQPFSPAQAAVARRLLEDGWRPGRAVTAARQLA